METQSRSLESKGVSRMWNRIVDDGYGSPLPDPTPVAIYALPCCSGGVIVPLKDGTDLERPVEVWGEDVPRIRCTRCGAKPLVGDMKLAGVVR